MFSDINNTAFLLTNKILFEDMMNNTAGSGCRAVIASHWTHDMMIAPLWRQNDVSIA